MYVWCNFMKLQGRKLYDISVSSYPSDLPLPHHKAWERSRSFAIVWNIQLAGSRSMQSQKLVLAAAAFLAVMGLGSPAMQITPEFEGFIRIQDQHFVDANCRDFPLTGMNTWAFRKPSSPPQRRILQSIYAHAQQCMLGDHARCLMLNFTRVDAATQISASDSSFGTGLDVCSLMPHRTCCCASCHAPIAAGGCSWSLQQGLHTSHAPCLQEWTLCSGRSAQLHRMASLLPASLLMESMPPWLCNPVQVWPNLFSTKQI